MNWLLEPLELEFMRWALLAAILAGFNCALVGVYVVLRRMAFLGGALSHTVLPGVILAFLAGIPVFWGALGAGVVTALGVGWIGDRRVIHNDTAIGVMLGGMFALGLLMMSMLRSFRDFSSILFGNILSVTASDLILIGIVSLIISGVLCLLHKEWSLSTLDSEYAEMVGTRPRMLHFLLLLLVALSVVSAIQVVGALLSSALLIIPAATARLITRSLPAMLACSCLIAVFSGFVGLYFSYYWGASSGASIALTATACFLAARIWHGLRIPTPHSIRM